MTATMTKPSTPKAARKDVCEVTFPVRLLNAIGAAHKEDTRYAMSSLLVHSKPGKKKAETDQIVVVGTNGRSMVIATSDTDLYGGEIDDVNIIVPGDVARNALKVAAKSEDDEPVATLKQAKNAFTLTVKTTSGESRFGWNTTGDTLPFPSYQEVLPNFALYGVSEIGVNPERTERVLHVIRKIVGGDHAATMFLPSKACDPLGMKATDGETIEVLAVVMPSPIGDWTKDAAGNDVADPDQREMFEAWRKAPLTELKLTEGLTNKLTDGEIANIGELADYLERGEILSDVEGVSAVQAEKITDAFDTYCLERQIAKPAKPPTPAEVALDQAQEGLLAYTAERFVHVGVPRETHQNEPIGEKMDEALLVMVMTKAQAKNVREAFEKAKVEDITGWLNKLKGFNDEKYREAATAAGFKFPKKTTLPS